LVAQFPQVRWIDLKTTAYAKRSALFAYTLRISDIRPRIYRRGSRRRINQSSIPFCITMIARGEM
jgi:hypothetical protein